MKTNLLTIILILGFITNVNAQGLAWAKSFGSAGTGIFSQSYDWAQEMATDPSGNIIVAGGFNGTVDFDPGIGVTNLTSAGGRDIFIAKYNTNGALIWAKRIGNTTDNDNISDLKCDASGNIFFTGQYSGTVDFDPNAGAYNLTSAGGADVFVSSLNVNGVLLGIPRTFGSTGGDYGVSLTLDNLGGIYVTGSFSGTVDFDAGAATYNLTSHGLADVFVFKYTNASGSSVFSWANNMGGAYNDGPADIELNTAQNYLYMVCSYSASITNGVTSFTAVGSNDVYLQRIPAASGGLNLAKTFGGASYDGVSDIEIDALDNVYLAGSFSGACDFDPSPGVTQLVVQTANDNDGFISKLNSNFVFNWVKQIESTSSDGGTKIIIDTDKNILLEGYFSGPDVDLDLSIAGTYTVSNNGGSNGDGLLIKMDPAGNFVWGKTWGNASGVNAQGFALDAKNNIYVSGDYFGTCDFDPDPINSYSLTANLYGSDAYLFKLFCTLPSTVTTTSNIVPLCLGASATKTIAISSSLENGVTYNWSSIGASGVSFSPTTGTSTSVSYTSTTSFSIIVTSTNACGTVTTMVQSITPYSLPSITINVTANPICYGDPAAFTASGASTYTWNPTYIINGMPTVNFGSGVFTVTATDINSCVNTNTISFTENPLPTITAVANPSAICVGNTSTLTAGGATSYTWTGGPQTQTYNVTSQGIYTVTGKDANNCVNTKTVGIIVNALPTLTVTANPTVVCAGTNATLVAAPPTLTYSWVSGPATNTYITGAAGIYTVTGTNGNNCSTTKTVNLIVNALPNVGATANPTAVCASSTLILTGSGATSYTWSNGSTNGVAFTPSGSNTYTVTGKDGNNCVNTKTITVNALSNPTLSISGNTLVCLNTTKTFTANGANTYTWSPGAITTNTFSILTNTTTTTYTVNGTAVNGCKNKKTLILNLVIPVTPDICEVTVDSLSNYNEIYWDKTLYNNVDSFIVYRETTIGNYSRIAAVSYTALSMYTDTNRTIGVINGNPNISHNRYKLQILDSCGNYGVKSPYHSTIFIQDQLNGNFNWDNYAIEGTSVTPVTAYTLKRRDTGTGIDATIGSSGGSSATDPTYFSYNAFPQYTWYVDAQGFSCNATFKTMAIKNKTKSNSTNERLATNITKNNAYPNNVSIFPNPVKDNVSVKFTALHGEKIIQIKNMLGQLLLQETTQNDVVLLDISHLNKGIYFVNIELNNKTVLVKKIVKE